MDHLQHANTLEASAKSISSLIRKGDQAPGWKEALSNIAIDLHQLAKAHRSALAAEAPPMPSTDFPN